MIDTESEVLNEMSIMVPSLAIAKEIDPDATRYGDVRIHWNPLKPEQVDRARKAFDRAIARGFRAIKLDRKGEKAGDYLQAFDPTAERIAFIPQIQGGKDSGVDVCNVVMQAHDLIDQGGWVQRSTRKGTAVCLSQACNEAVAAAGKDLPSKERDLLKELVDTVVIEALPAGARSAGIIAYNDATGRTKEEVLRVLREAATCNGTDA